MPCHYLPSPPPHPYTCCATVLLYIHSLHVLHDEAKDKPFELEMAWVCEETGWKYQSVPQEQVRSETGSDEGAPGGDAFVIFIME